jgi:uncharacterized membrane protein
MKVFFPRSTLWAIALLAIAAGGLAGYLLDRSLQGRSLPVGCGSGSSCEEVLNSQWSQVFGIPVSGLAAAVYILILADVPFVANRWTACTRRRAWSVLLFLAAVVAMAAIWFVGVQSFVIRKFCPWCLVEHGLGTIMAALVFSRAPIAWKRSPMNGDMSDSPILRVGNLAGGLGFGFIATAGLATAQTAIPYQAPVLRLPAGQNADIGQGADRRIAVLNGSLILAPRQIPSLGSPDRPTLLVVLFDYCCPHCRATHADLLEILGKTGNELGILLLPTPLNERCNPHWERTEPRFANACELARLALAVWRANPAVFADFDTWLFESERPRDPQEARRRAAELVTETALQRSLADAWTAKQIERNVDAYHDSQAKRLPVILSPGMATIVGRPQSAEQLLELLQNELPLSPR